MMSPHTHAGGCLVVRTAPDPDEGLHQYLSRLAALNGYRDPRWLLRGAGLPRTFLTTPCDLARVAAMLDGAVDADALAASAYWPLPGAPDRLRFGGVPSGVSPRALALARGKVCPACRGDGRPAHRTWDLFGIAVCLRHGCLLRDACASCGAAFPLLGPGLPGWRTRCLRCGGPALAEPAPAPAPAAALAGWLDALARGGNPPGHAVPLRGLDAAVHLVRFFGAKDMEAGGRRWRSGYIAKPRVDEMLAVIERAAAVLLDWPDGFIDYLERHRRAPDTQVGLAAEFGSLLVRLRSALDEPRFEAVLDLARRHVARTIPGPTVKPWSFFSARPDHGGPAEAPTVSGVAAARALGVSVASVARMIAAGELKGESRRMGRRQAHLVDAAALAAMAAQRSRSLSAAQAASELGLTPYQVERLRSAGLLHGTRGLGMPAHEHRFAPADLTAFVDRLHRAIQADRAAPPRTHAVSLSEVAGMRAFSLVEVVRRIISGILPVFAAPDGLSGSRGRLGRLMVSRSRLLGQRADPAGGISLDVRRAAKGLGVSVRMIPVLVRAGCLGAGSRGADTLARRSVSATSVAGFRRGFVMARTLAARHRTSTRMVVKGLAAAGVAPVVASDPRKGISAVWRRDDVDAVDLGRVLRRMGGDAS
ncbi:TniQ family protein [Microvirga soli]|uniref:TniQ family protein n=1 Tax=Microvirga soli TaxID=1854496 RepID=UPI001920337E|nr:TniQ family protein [Microvirga soli]